jgi:hypothetical protein
VSTALVVGALEVIRATPSALRALVAGLPDELLRDVGPEGWSPADVIAHLVVAGRLGALDRVRRALAEDAPSFAGYDEEGELDASGLRGEGVAGLIELLEVERSGHPALVGSLTTSDLERGGMHEEVGAVSVAELLHQAAYHDRIHVAQVASLTSSSFEAGRGPLGAAQS